SRSPAPPTLGGPSPMGPHPPRNPARRNEEDTCEGKRGRTAPRRRPPLDRDRSGGESGARVGRATTGARHVPMARPFLPSTPPRSALLGAVNRPSPPRRRVG